MQPTCVACLPPGLAAADQEAEIGLGMVPPPSPQEQALAAFLAACDEERLDTLSRLLGDVEADYLPPGGSTDICRALLTDLRAARRLAE